MKNYLLLTASAVLVLSSCSNNEIVENKELKNGEPKKMSISAYVPGMTRGLYDAKEADVDSLKKYGFALLTSQVNEDYEMFRTQLAFNSENNVWGPASGEAEPAWPANPTETVEFFGVYPPEAVGEDGLEIVVDGGYALPFEGSADQDLMIAHTSKSLAASNNGNVRLDFSHVLAKVEVKFVGKQAGYNYQVGNVKLTTPKATEYRFNYSEFSLAEAQTVEYDLDEITNVTDDVFKIEGETVDGNAVTTDTLNYGQLMVIPGECSLSLGYSIAMPDQTAKAVTLNEPITFTAQAGVRNIVVVTLAPKAKDMTFTVNVGEWTNGTTTERDIEL
ncbi:MAG: fimbrillin family protein [Bacteroidales bacterium]|nr:fimbrillin family protein [Bacteroidales bacterium]